MELLAGGGIAMFAVIWIGGGILGMWQLGKKGYLSWWRSHNIVWWVLFGWWLAYAAVAAFVSFGLITLAIAVYLPTRWGYGDKV